jgi:hypothetical protein
MNSSWLKPKAFGPVVIDKMSRPESGPHTAGVSASDALAQPHAKMHTTAIEGFMIAPVLTEGRPV